MPTSFENPVGQATNQQYENQYGHDLRRSAHSTNPSATDWHFMTIALGSRSEKADMHVAVSLDWRPPLPGATDCTHYVQELSRGARGFLGLLP